MKFNLYFIICYGIFICMPLSITLYDKCENIQYPALQKLIVTAFNWCVNKFGIVDLVNGIPKLKIRKVSKKYYGYTLFDKNEIVIYAYKSETVSEIINTVIHEYVHVLQYQRNMDFIYDSEISYAQYVQHPTEIDAVKKSKKYTNLCWDQIKHLI